MPNAIDEAVTRSKHLLRAAATPSGFVASPDLDHYAVIWARDALITCLGALRADEPSLVETAAATIDTLVLRASPLGQVPALVDPARSTWDFGEGGAVDTSAWLPIAVAEYLDATGDVERTAAWWPAVQRAMDWLAHQDVTGSGLLSTAPSTDWMDAALSRSGRTLHLNALYAWALRAAARIGVRLDQPFTPPVPDIARRVDAWFWPSEDVSFADLYPSGFAHDALVSEYRRVAAIDRTHYSSHIVHAAIVDHVDVLANCLTILAGVADTSRSETILATIEACSVPWPSRTFYAPVSPDDPSGMLNRSIDAAIDPRWSNRPGRYHNGAAWPYVGGFHAAAVTITHGAEAAAPMLERLSEVNALDDWRFPEWVGADGPDGASQQTWNAGTFLYAWSMAEPRPGRT